MLMQVLHSWKRTEYFSDLAQDHQQGRVRKWLLRMFPRVFFLYFIIIPINYIQTSSNKTFYKLSTTFKKSYCGITSTLSKTFNVFKTITNFLKEKKKGISTDQNKKFKQI